MLYHFHHIIYNVFDHIFLICTHIVVPTALNARSEGIVGVQARAPNDFRCHPPRASKPSGANDQRLNRDYEKASRNLTCTDI